jgi:hypothetical protein
MHHYRNSGWRIVTGIAGAKTLLTGPLRTATKSRHNHCRSEFFSNRIFAACQCRLGACSFTCGTGSA